MNEIERKYNVVVKLLDNKAENTTIGGVSEHFFDLIEKHMIECERWFTIVVENEFNGGALSKVTKTITIYRQDFLLFTERLAEATE